MNTNKKVDDFFDKLDHPFKSEMIEIRKIILSADSKMEEDIKWGAPTFMYNGNMATFNVRAKKFINLTFHTGAKINDQFGILKGDAAEARVARFESQEDIESQKEGLIAVSKEWIKANS